MLPLQDDYMDALAKLHVTVSRAFKINPKIKFEVFIHKVDGLSDDNKIESQRDIHQRATDDLIDAGLENLHLRYCDVRSWDSFSSLTVIKAAEEIRCIFDDI